MYCTTASLFSWGFPSIHRGNYSTSSGPANEIHHTALLCRNRRLFIHGSQLQEMLEALLLVWLPLLLSSPSLLLYFSTSLPLSLSPPSFVLAFVVKARHVQVLYILLIISEIYRVCTEGRIHHKQKKKSSAACTFCVTDLLLKGTVALYKTREGVFLWT